MKFLDVDNFSDDLSVIEENLFLFSWNLDVDLKGSEDLFFEVEIEVGGIEMEIESVVEIVFYDSIVGDYYDDNLNILLKVFIRDVVLRFFEMKEKLSCF